MSVLLCCFEGDDDGGVIVVKKIVKKSDTISSAESVEGMMGIDGIHCTM